MGLSIEERAWLPDTAIQSLSNGFFMLNSKIRGLNQNGCFMQS